MKSLPSFERPPLVEVVCGVFFQNLEKFLSPHTGLLWEKFREDYPSIEEHPPLSRPTETSIDGGHGSSLVISTVPLPQRSWFVSSKESRIIQVQRDVFLHNWRKTEQDPEYPRFPKVYAEFSRRYETFRGFLKSNDLGVIMARQYELTYLNHIPIGEGWNELKDIGELFPDITWAKSGSPGRFLSAPNSISVTMSFAHPDEIGRLHVKIQRAIRRKDSSQIIVFDLTARSIPDKKPDCSMSEWFEKAREWIVRSFADLTGPKPQEEVWGRIQ